MYAQEYQTQKDKSGKAPGMGAEAEQQLAGELDRLKTVYGGGDLSQFPNFDFKDTKIGMPQSVLCVSCFDSKLMSLLQIGDN